MVSRTFAYAKIGHITLCNQQRIRKTSRVVLAVTSFTPTSFQSKSRHTQPESNFGTSNRPPPAGIGLLHQPNDLRGTSGTPGHNRDTSLTRHHLRRSAQPEQRQFTDLFTKSAVT